MSVRARRIAVTGGAWRAALLPAAAFAVHQLRYELAFGSGTGAELQRTGHSYLHSAVPWIVVAVAFAAGCFLRALGEALAGQTSAVRFTVSFTGLWAGCAAALIAIFCAQELLEGVFAAGHPVGLAAVFGFGGWWAIPVAVCVGLVLAAVLHGARWAVRAVAQRRRTPRRRRGPAVAVDRPSDVLLPTLGPLRRGRSSRGPPLPS